MLSIVVISRPANRLAARVQERMGWPSTCTVQAPQRPAPQPNFVPVRPSVSRKTQSRGVSGSASTSTVLPLIFSANITIALHDRVGDVEGNYITIVGD